MSSRTYKLAAWATAAVAFGAWQFYDYKHPKEFSQGEQDAWNERVKRETQHGAKLSGNNTPSSKTS